MQKLAFFFALLVLFLAGLGRDTSPQPERGEESPWLVWVSDTHLGFKKSNEAFDSFLKDAGQLSFKPRFLIHGGDITEVGQEEMFGRYVEGVRSLGLESLNVIGNHDTRWNPSGKNAFVEGIGPRYFSKDFEGIHWLFLDTTLEHQTHGHVDFQEVRWLKRHLAAVPREQPILVFSHHPLVWHGISVDNGLDVLNLFESHNVAAFFNGHGHKLKTISFRQIPFVENDALFHNQYVVMQKEGEKLKLFSKTIGAPELKPWLELDLHPKRSPIRILSPRHKGRVGKSFTVRARAEEEEEATLQVDRNEQVPFQLFAHHSPVFLKQSVVLEDPGWHRLRVYRAGSEWPEDEADAVQHGPMKVFPVGEIYASLATDGRRVFAGTLGGALFALNAARGTVRWKRDLDGAILASPVYASGVVYVGTRSGSLYAFRASNGALLWKTALGSPFTASPLPAFGVLLASNGPKLHALEPKSGKKRWEADLGSFTEAQPAVGSGNVYVGAWNQAFYAFRLSDGHPLWKKTIGKALYYSPAVTRPSARGSLVYVAGKDQTLYALDGQTGQEKWTADLDAGFANPLLLEDEIVVPETRGRLVSLDLKTGEPQWEKQLGTSFFNASPVRDGERLYVVGVDGLMFRFDVERQRVEGRLQVSRGFNFSTPVVAAGKLWVGSLDGNLYAVPLDATARGIGARVEIVGKK